MMMIAVQLLFLLMPFMNKARYVPETPETCQGMQTGLLGRRQLDQIPANV